MRFLIIVTAIALAQITACGGEQAATTDPLPSPPTTEPTTEPRPRPQPHVIPDDFPLLDGYPSDDDAEADIYGREGPSRSLDPLVPEACGRRVPLPEHTDVLQAAWTNPEDYRRRQLVTFADVERSRAYAEHVVAVFASCPEEVTSEEMNQSRTFDVVPAALGDWSRAVSSVGKQEGYPIPGLTTWHVVRVETTVLLALTSNEGGAGPDPEHDAAAQRAADARSIAGVVEAMDMFRDYPSEPPFGPEGFARVTLGLPRDALLALPAVRITGGTDRCETFAAGGVSGGLERGRGVIYLEVRADLETPERVHVGSTDDEVRRAYPRAVGDEVFLTAEPPGLSDRYYRFDLGADGRVTEIKLVSDHQSCVS